MALSWTGLNLDGFHWIGLVDQDFGLLDFGHWTLRTVFTEYGYWFTLDLDLVFVGLVCCVDKTNISCFYSCTMRFEAYVASLND